jgi:alanyl-tRNA synthetase
MCSAASCAAPSATATSWARRTPFFHKLRAPTWCALMGAAYPELGGAGKRITEVLKAEEERFFETLGNRHANSG